MPETVVDRLEVVEIEDEHRDVAVLLRPASECVLDAIGEQSSVREARQRVVERLVPELVLRFPPGGDVEEVALQHASAVRILDDARLVVDPDHASVPRVEAILDLERLAGRVRPGVSGEDLLPVVGMEERKEELGVLRPLLGREAEHGLDLGARVDVGAHLVEPVDIDGERQLLHERPEPRFCAAECLFGLLALRDVQREPLPERHPFRRLHDHGSILDPHQPAVGRPHPVLEPERLPARVGLVPGREHAAEVLLVDRRLVDPRRPEPLLGGVAEHPLDLGADVARADLRILGRRGVGDEGQLLDESAVAELRRPQSFRRGPALREIPDAGREHGRPGELDTADRELGREDLTVGAQRFDLDAPAEERSRANGRAGPARQRPPVRVAVGRRHDEIRDLGAHDLVPREAEDLLGRVVELEHAPLVVDRDDRVERGVQDRPGVRVAQVVNLGARRARFRPLRHRLPSIVTTPAPGDPRAGYVSIRRCRAAPGRG